MAFKLPELPYPVDALAPYMSARTLEFHHGKHHKSYVKKLNAAVQETRLEGKSLEHIIQKTAGKSAQVDIFNNAAQVWNHNFYWRCMRPNANKNPSDMLAKQLSEAFGSIASFKKQFSQAAGKQFGTGWTWLYLDGDALQIGCMSDAETPVMNGHKPLLTCDVWEHAYYLDYQNRKDDFVKTFLDKLVNWDFVAQQLNENS